MNQETIAELLALNRQFYAAFARLFAATRPVADPALTAALPHIPRRGALLDVGCGNGRLALLLDQHRPGITYLGVDAVPELIEVARALRKRLTSVPARFAVADVARPGWRANLPEQSFDCITLLAVLHHIPGSGLRQRVLADLAGLLAPQGRLILSTWQFLSNARMRRKIVDWSEADVPEEGLEAGDYLLDWKRGGRGLRYCHAIDRAEIDQLAAGSGLVVRETFRAGGREGDLSLFAVLEVGG